MNPQDQDLPKSDLPGDVSPAEAPPPKPRRKRAGSAAPVGAPEVLAEAPATVAEPVQAAIDEPVAEASVKPKRARRKAAELLADAQPDVGDSAVTAPAQVAVATVAAPEAVLDAAGLSPAPPAKPRRRTAAAANVAVPVQAAAEAAVAVSATFVPSADAALTVATAMAMAADAADGAATAPAKSVDLEEAGSQGVEGVEGAEGDGTRRRNRNRRRGRRGGADRALREDGSPADDSAVLNATVTSGDDDDDDERSVPTSGEVPRAAPLDAGETFAAVLSGDYDAEPAGTGAPAEPEKRVLAAEPDAPKLHKVLAQAGIGSRRDMEELIAEGQVQVNGQVAHTGQRISFGDRISVAGKLIKVRIAPPPPRVIAYHKPVGEVVTNDDPQHRPTVYRRLPRLAHGKWQSVGRLDINTEGLLLFTNSGELANQLMHPRFGVEREYAVRVLGTLEADAKARLLEGVDIDGQRAMFQSIEDGGGEGVNRWYRVVITEGRNREVRKLFDKVGLGVSRLIRIRYGCVVLPRGLRRGLFVDLNEAEVREVRRLASVGRDLPAAAPRAPRPEASGPREGQVPRDVQGPRESQGPREGQGQNRGNSSKGRGGPQQQRADRAERPERPDRPEREQRPERGPAVQPNRPQERRERPAPRPPAADGDFEQENFAAIPNPLMQTFDKRAIREARAPRREISEDGPIPNPLEQTYDKRFVQKPKGFGIGGGGGGGRKGGGGDGGQPDPMKTSLGYIGADAFVRKFQGNGGAGGGGGGGGGAGGNRGGRRTGGGSGGGGGGGGGGGRRGGGGR